MFSLFKRLFQTRADPARGEPHAALSEDELNACIDLAVKQFDRRLAAIPGYRKALRQPVATTLLYLETLIERIPGPFEVSKRAYAADPRVHAYFGSFEQIEHLFSHSRDFREFADTTAASGLSHAYGLLIMSRQEKKRPGNTQDGDGSIPRNTMQDVVVFSQHHLAAPAGSEEDTRRRLRRREFKDLVAEAVLQVARHKENQADLERKRIHLKMELDNLPANPERVDAAAGTAPGGSAAHARLTRELHEVEAEIANHSRRLESINDYLKLLIAVLANPSDYCTLELDSDCLNRANQKVDEDKGKQVPYARLVMGNRRYHMVAVKHPLDEMADRSSIADLVDKVYGH